MAGLVTRCTSHNGFTRREFRIIAREEGLADKVQEFDLDRLPKTLQWN